MSENKTNNNGCGLLGCLINIVALILICMLFSLFLGSGEFYNESLEKFKIVLNLDTVQVDGK